MPPLVSFFMTVRNGLPMVREAIESLQRQTYPNWEAVIVDDGSTDGTLEVLKDEAERDPRLVVIATSGIGRGKALNLAVSHTRGEYIANLDADDLAHPQRAEIQQRFLARADTSAALVACHAVYFETLQDFVWEAIGDTGTSEDVTARLKRSNPFGHSSVMMRKRALLRAGGYDEVRTRQIDYELWGRLARHGYRLHKLDAKLSAKRIHALQSYENKNRLRYLISSVLLQRKIIKDLSGGAGDTGYMLLRLVGGVLPQRLRILARKWH